MTATLETLVAAAYVFADELRTPCRLGRPPVVSDEELIALAVGQAITGICSDRQFLGVIGKLLPGWFPRLPSQPPYDRRLRRLMPKLVWVQQRLSELLATGRLRLADGTLIGVANYAGCAQKSEFAGLAAYGYCPSKSRYYWGVRLVLLVDRKGLPVGYTLCPANETEYERVRELTTTRTPPGLIQRIAQRLLALTLGMLLNALIGRPPRALVAYDGRQFHIKPLGRPRPTSVARRGVPRPGMSAAGR
jgi:hypothetical protein